MAVNLRLGINSGTIRPVERRRSLARRRSLNQRSEEPQFQLKFEWRETPEAFILTSELPGFKKENLSVYIDLYRNLTVKGERPTEESGVAGESRLPREKPRFRRVFNVPENVDTSSITATLHNEILYITVPKLNTTSQTRSIEINEHDNRGNDKPISNVADQGIKSDQTPMKDGAESSVIKKKETQKSEELGKDIADQGIKSDQTAVKDGAEPSVIKKEETQLENKKCEELGKDTADQGIKSDQTPVKDGAEPSVIKNKETQLENKKSEELGKVTADQGIKSDQTPVRDCAEPNVIKKKETQKSEELGKVAADQGIKSDQTPVRDGAEPNVIKKKETQKFEDLGKDTADQGIKSDQIPVKDGAEPSVIKKKETQKPEELGKDTTTGSGISKDEPESVKSELEKIDLVKPSELDPKSKENETVEKAPEQTKIDPSLPAEESLPPPLEEGKEKSETAIQEVKEKEYASDAVDEKPKLKTHEIKEEKLSSGVNESERASTGKGAPISCIFQSKMWRRRMLVVFAIVVFYIGLYITRRLRSADD